MFRMPLVIEHPLNGLSNKPFNVAETTRLGLVTEGDRDAFSSGSCGASDAVHIALGDIRQIVVEDVTYAIYVDPSRGDIRCHEDSNLSGLESCQCSLPGCLAFVSVDSRGVDSSFREIFRDSVCPMFRACEDDGAFDFWPQQHVA